MRRIILSKLALVAVIVVFTLTNIFAGVPVRAFEGGDGSQEAPYRVGDCQQLQNINQDLDAYYVLANNIDCLDTENWNDGAGFAPLGDYDDPFVGELDGQGYRIFNLFIDTSVSDNDSGGLFRQVGAWDNQTGLVTQLGLEDISVTGAWSTGGVAGRLYGQVNNVYTTGTVHSTGGEAGGLVGSHGGTWDTVIDSWSSATVSTEGDVAGGLVGYNASDSNIINSYATGDVFAGDDYAGGLVGINDGTIERSHATGTVVANDHSAGGLVSRNDNEASITRSYATGDVSAANDNVGGFVGRNFGSITTSYSHNVAHTSPQLSVRGNCNVGGFAGLNEGEITNAYSRSSVTTIMTACAVGGFAGIVDYGQLIYTYSTGEVTGGLNDVGGHTGSAIGDNGGDISSSFWDAQSSGESDACGSLSTFDCNGVLKIMSRQTAAMKTLANYTDELGEGAWDFGSIWTFVTGQNDDYPIFQMTIGATAVALPDHSDEQDLNGDEIDDSLQPNIGGYTSSITGKIVAIDVGDGCELTTDDMTTEAQLTVQDPAYEYANGLWNFEADCGTPGYTTTVTLYYYNVAPSGLVLRKHNPNTGAFFTINDASISNQTINNSQVTVVTYQVTDGGERDTDGIVDGMISDPAGLAVLVIGVPNTGFGTRKGL